MANKMWFGRHALALLALLAVGCQSSDDSASVINIEPGPNVAERLQEALILAKPGDVIQIRNRPKSIQAVKTCLEEVDRAVPEFLTRADGDSPQGQMVRFPEPEDVSIPVQTNLIVELCSK